jgi:hypothetical protein
MVAARITGTIVHFGDLTVVDVGHGTVVDVGHGTGVHVGDGAVRYVVESAAMEATMEPPAVEPAAMAAPAPSKGEVWLAERSNAQHGSCGPS